MSALRSAYLSALCLRREYFDWPSRCRVPSSFLLTLPSCLCRWRLLLLRFVAIAFKAPTLELFCPAALVSRRIAGREFLRVSNSPLRRSSYRGRVPNVIRLRASGFLVVSNTHYSSVPSFFLSCVGEGFPSSFIPPFQGTSGIASFSKAPSKKVYSPFPILRPSIEIPLPLLPSQPCWSREILCRARRFRR